MKTKYRNTSLMLIPLIFSILLPLTSCKNGDEVYQINRVVCSTHCWEPYSTDTLFNRADFVGIVQIRSGYMSDQGIRYHAKVIEKLKAAWPIPEFDFWGYPGEEVGSNYLIFLSLDSAQQFIPMERNRASGFFLCRTESFLHNSADGFKRVEVFKVALIDVTLPKSLTRYQINGFGKIADKDNDWDEVYVKKDELINHLREISEYGNTSMILTLVGHRGR